MMIPLVLLWLVVNWYHEKNSHNLYMLIFGVLLCAIYILHQRRSRTEPMANVNLESLKNHLDMVRKMHSGEELPGNLNVAGTATASRVVASNDIILKAKNTDQGIKGIALWRKDKNNREHQWKWWHMDKTYGENDLELWEYAADGSGKTCGGNRGDGAMCDPVMTIGSNSTDKRIRLHRPVVFEQSTQFNQRPILCKTVQCKVGKLIDLGVNATEWPGVSYSGHRAHSLDMNEGGQGVHELNIQKSGNNWHAYFNPRTHGSSGHDVDIRFTFYHKSICKTEQGPNTNYWDLNA